MSIENNNYSIFRSEALQHKQENWLGSARLQIPRSFSVFLLCGFLVCFIIGLIIILGSYSERINVSGTVIYNPPAVSLIAQGAGMITYSSLAEGAITERGKLILSVSGDVQTHLGGTDAERLELLKIQRDAISEKIKMMINEVKEEAAFLSVKINNKQQEIASMNSLINELESQKKWFQRKLDTYSDLRGKGMALDSELIDRRKDYYLSAESLSSAKLKLVALEGELIDFKKKALSLEGEREERLKSFIIETANIDQKILDAEKNKEYLIISPFDGVITSVSSHTGERVTAGQRIAVLVPQRSKPEIELLATSDSLGEVVSGLRVKMRVAAYPYQWYGKITGVIETISAAPVNLSTPLQLKSENSGKGLFRIMVKPELSEQQRRDISLLPGMEVETEIYIKTRKIYEWLFIPLKRVYHRIRDDME